MIPDVLIVDDSPDIRLVVKAYLEQWAVHVQEAPSGKAALAEISSRPFELIFVDLIMPEMDGPEVIEELRQLEDQLGREPSYVVVLSGSHDPKDWARAQKAGMDCQLEKPIAIDKLASIMARLGAQEV